MEPIWQKTHACWKKCNDLAQQEENKDKIAGLSKPVLVSNWDAAIATMTAEEKAHAESVWKVFLLCLTKAQEERDKPQEAPEIKLMGSASSGEKPAVPATPVNPDQMDDRAVDKRKAEEGGNVDERKPKKPPGGKKEAADEEVEGD